MAALRLILMEHKTEHPTCTATPTTYPALSTGKHYQAHCADTAIYPFRDHARACYAMPFEKVDGALLDRVRAMVALQYLAGGLCGEAGEVAGILKKVCRDDRLILDSVALSKIQTELGDCLWYIAELCTVLGLSLDDCMALNLQKLADRKERGVLGGSGDSR